MTSNDHLTSPTRFAGESCPQSPVFTWAGRAMSGLVVVFLLVDGAIKLVPLPVVGETLAALGFPPERARLIGVLTIVPTVLYAWPRTALLGAVLLTGLLGGAMAAHLRVGSPVFSHLLFGFYVGCLAWGGLYLRDRKLRSMLPLKRHKTQSEGFG